MKLEIDGGLEDAKGLARAFTATSSTHTVGALKSVKVLPPFAAYEKKAAALSATLVPVLDRRPGGASRRIPNDENSANARSEGLAREVLAFHGTREEKYCTYRRQWVYRWTVWQFWRRCIHVMLCVVFRRLRHDGP